MAARTSTVREGRTFTETARREQIVQAAIATLAELGYADTSLLKIAKTAGLSSVGMVSYYFSGKAELMDEVVAAVLARAGAEVAPRVAAGETAADRLRVYIEASLEYIARHRDEAVALIEITVAARDLAGDREAGAVEIVTDLVTKAQAERTGRDPMDPELVAVAIRGAINSAVGHSLRRRPGRGEDPELAAAGPAIAELFARAL